ncbi:hypothetical protein Moror_16661 [Moniliophthora roreri MCA 2997]|uniref:Uncharacterized protein n=1 Tax=Moniliophthora roreri (strain MCA 2997) TaxID=1381753 RepID=V2WXD7_MONRO|nr:hypothetical protein Moror_16661 [Moniliophthora roreri MCA 2997]
MTTGSPTPSPSISKLTIQLNLASVTPSPSLAVATASASETDDDSDVVDISLCSNKSNPAHSFGIHGLQNAVYDYTRHPTFLGGAEADDDLEREQKSIGLVQSQDRHDSDEESSIEGSSSEESSSETHGKAVPSKFSAVLTGASEGVTEGTAASYRE